MASKPKLITIDGNSLLYRAFFAVRHLSTSGGTPTNAIYGLTTMLLKVLEEKPDYVAVAFDTPKPTFRHEEYKEYKAHRKAPPDALIEQQPIARELIRAFNIPVVEVEGFEADDVVGAMAKKAKGRGIETIIVTGDLDTLQLVDNDVRVMTTVKGVSDTVVYDTQAVIDRFGIRPDQMTDFKGLKGDASDNIPGVPGIGDKTAVSLLREYGSVENLLQHASELPEGRVKTAIEQNTQLAELSKHLATIVTDLPVEIVLDEYKAREPDYDALRDLFVRLEFKTMLKRLPEVAEAAGKADVTERLALGACRRIESPQELSDLLKTLKSSGAFALQCHTADGKSIDARLIGIGFSMGPGNSAYVEIGDKPITGGSLELAFDCDNYCADLSELAPILESSDIEKYCHDCKLSYAALALRGVKLSGVKFDTMLVAYLLDATRGSFEIGDVAFEQLGLEMPGVTKKVEEGDSDTTSLICGQAEAIYRLKPAMEQRLADAGLTDLYETVEMPLSPILAEMELTGVAVDVRQLEALSTELDAEIRQLEENIYAQAGEEFNIGSPRQIQAILFEKLGLEVEKKTKTGFSTSASALDALTEKHPIVEFILRWRELTKIKSTYADSLPKLINPRTGRIHTSLNQAVTATGRLSSSDPNLQNIPIRTKLGREIRKAFVASGDNLLLSADYSQIELRILAHFTGDAGLTRAFEQDEDIHTATACTIFECSPDEVTPEMRRRAKTINFAVIYGMADFTLSKQLGTSVHEARDYIETYFSKFPGVRAYTEETLAKARELGYVSTLLGRRRYIPDINNSNRNVRMIAERAAVNMPIQGTAADVMKLAMIRVHSELNARKTGAKMLLQVHDELLLEVPRSELDEITRIVRGGMESAYRLSVPLRVDVKMGANWSEMQV